MVTFRCPLLLDRRYKKTASLNDFFLESLNDYFRGEPLKSVVSRNQLAEATLLGGPPIEIVVSKNYNIFI